MSEQATDFVFEALTQMEAIGAHPRATTAALARLGATANSVPTPARHTPVAKKPAPPAETAPMPRLDPAPAPIPVPPNRAASNSKADRLALMRGPVLGCTLCPHLVKSRTQVVFGVGNPEAELMFIGEAPGADEDLAGEPFVGKAGQLLTKIIDTMGFRRADVYIANVVKCRPDTAPGESGNRKPTSKEMDTCKPYLLEQIQIIQPRVIVALGATAMEGLLGSTTPIGKIRGQWQEFRGIPLMPTFHPAYLLRNQSLAEKRKVWEDMLLVLERLGRQISDQQRAYFLSRI